MKCDSDSGKLEFDESSLFEFLFYFSRLIYKTDLNSPTCRFKFKYGWRKNLDSMQNDNQDDNNKSIKAKLVVVDNPGALLFAYVCSRQNLKLKNHFSPNVSAFSEVRRLDTYLQQTSGLLDRISVAKSH
jgi:hypothetical protein